MITPDNKTFLFINLSLGVRTKGVNHGIAALVPLVKKHSYNVSLLHLDTDLDADAFMRKVREFNPSIVGFSATTHQVKYLTKFSHALKPLCGILKIGGGVHPTIDPVGTLMSTALDAVCVGEGERPIQDLLSKIESKADVTSAEGFYWNIGGSIRKNPVPDFIKDLSVLDYPEYDVFDRDIAVSDWSTDRSLVVENSDKMKLVEVMVSRGCPFECHYCCNQAIKRVYHSDQGYFRLPTVEWAVAAIRYTLEKYPEADCIGFSDDLLIANPAWFKDFAIRYKAEIGLPYRTCGRFESITPEITKSLKESGCIRLVFGLESGDETLRRQLLNRHHSNALIIERCKMVKAAGIPFTTFNIIGLPMETKLQMRSTLELNRKIKPEFGTCFYFHPYKNTWIYKYCEEHNLLKDDREISHMTSNYDGPYIRLTKMSDRDCIRFHKKMTAFFFIQTCLYRCRNYIACNKGINKAGIILIVLRLMCKGIKVYYIDYIKPKIFMKSSQKMDASNPH